MNKSIPNPVPASVWDKVLPTGFCWEWHGTRRRNGYGVIGIAGSQYMAHRVIYAALIGDPGELDLDHLCRNVCCVNPDHLEPVNKATNTMRGFNPMAMNSRKAQCVNGHQLPEAKPGQRRICASCASEYRRIQASNAYRADPEAGAERARQYRKANQEAVNARARERRALRKQVLEPE